MISYNNKKFRSISNSESGEISPETIFKYFQKEGILWGNYSGGSILLGNIVGIVDGRGEIKMRYQHISNDGSFKTGKCISSPEILSNKKIRLHEKWEWTSGKTGIGNSVIEEI